MMRIGQFSETFFPVVDGVGRVVFSYADKLAELGHECYVVTPVQQTGYRGTFPFEIIDYSSFKVPGAPQYRTGVACLDHHYRRRIKDVRFDIIHAHTPFSVGREALFAAKRSACPLVGTFHSRYYDDFYKITGSKIIAKIGALRVAHFYEHCDEVWTVGKQSAETLLSYGYKGEVLVVENGTELKMPVREHLEKAETLFGLSGSDPVLLYVGQMDWKKNILNILEAASKLKQNCFRFRLVLAGQGPDSSSIESKAAELGIAGHCVFTGHLADQEVLNGLYQRATLLVFPSLYDSAPMVLREAAVMSTPAVLTINSSAAEVLRDGENGFLAGNSPESLAEVIIRAMADEERLARIADAARATIPVSWDSVIGRVLSRYQSLIEKNLLNGYDNYKRTKNKQRI